ncbi:MAG: sigma-70 family RNA polymerase sigma factor [Candidatus Hydrogenedentes bacterium]|nr:sigma-70 family RNA polymerase sigma factor [Candidatus Hydrogenedentota bacterium]
MSDADLVRLVLSGNRDRFIELVDRYLPMLRGLCASYVADASAQQDLVQETLIYAYERLGILRDGDRFGAWLAKIGRSHCIDWLRKQRREDRARDRVAEHAPAHGAETGEAVAMRRELREWVRSRIAQLPAKTREAMVLCYIEGYDSTEAARFLGVREAALRKRLEYGRRLVGEKVCAELGETKSEAADFAVLRKRVLLALPAAAIPVKASTAASVAAILGESFTVKSALLAIAVCTIALGLLFQRQGVPEQPEAPIVQVASAGSSVGQADPIGNRDASASGPVEESSAQDTADGGKIYDRFFFIRYNTEKDRVQSSTPVLATITPDGIELADGYTRSGQWSQVWPLYVGAGRVFAETSEDEGSLISIDAQTGNVEKIASVERLCAGPGKLYEAIRNGDTATIRVYDSSRQAHCDLVRIPWNSQIRDVEVSPDNRYLAYFAPKRDLGGSGDKVIWSNVQTLNIVDLHSGVVSEIGSPIEHREPAISSAMYGTPPFVWLDSTRVLAVRAEDESGRPASSIVYSDGAKRYLTSIDTNTGETKDLVEIPGNPIMSRVRLRPGELDGQPIVDVQSLGKFQIDADGGSLSEYDGIGGAYRLTRTENSYTLFDSQKVVSTMTGNVDHALSPDGRQIFWTAKNVPRATYRDGNSYPMKLRYYDAGQGKIREVAEGYFQLPNPGWRCWLSNQDLAREVEPAPKDEGWVPFSSEPWPAERPRRTDPRPDVNEHLALEIATDADMYWLHQPIEVSVTLTNIGSDALTLLRPVVFDERTMHTSVEGPGWRGLVSQIQTYLPEPEEIVLGPGESATATGTLELSREGTYSITAEFRGLADDPSQRFRGRVRTEAAAFEIHRSADDSALFQEKVDRLLAKATAEFESAPDWEGANETLDSLGAMGVEAGPDLLTFISSVEDSRFRVLLLRPLIDIAYPEAMPYFAELLEYGTPGEQDAALRGLDTLYRRHKGCERDDIAQSALIHLMTAAHINDARARGTLVRSLSKVKDDRVREALERFVDDPEESIRDTAARYLARHDGLELADWIARAAAQPSATQYSIARSLVSQLERTWRVNNGDFPEGDWSQVGSDATATAQYRATLLAWERWARENPRSAGQLLNPPQE